MDSLLPNSNDSVIWSDEFMGTIRGPVLYGTFAGWKTITDQYLERDVGAIGKTFNDSEVAQFINTKDINRIFAPPLSIPVCEIQTFV